MTRSSSPRWTTTAASPRGSSSRTTATSSSATSSSTTTRRSTSTTCRPSSQTARGSSRSRGRRTRSARSPTRGGSASSRTRSARWRGSTRSTTPRTSRSTSAPSTPTSCICSPYKFCGPHLGMAYGRAEVIERWRPYKARPAAYVAARPPLRDRDPALRAARRPERHVRLPRRHRWLRGDRALRAGARRALPRRAARRGARLRPADDGGPCADVPRQPRWRAGGAGGRSASRARDGRLGPRLVVLAEPLRAVRLRLGRRGSDRLHPLQHGRRGRPPRRRADADRAR